eukprot:1158803-Pelagomonas_calceolata.AAC.6
MRVKSEFDRVRVLPHPEHPWARLVVTSLWAYRVKWARSLSASLVARLQGKSFSVQTSEREPGGDDCLSRIAGLREEMREAFHYYAQILAWWLCLSPTACPPSKHATCTLCAYYDCYTTQCSLHLCAHDALWYCTSWLMCLLVAQASGLVQRESVYVTKKHICAGQVKEDRQHYSDRSTREYVAMRLCGFEFMSEEQTGQC